MQYEIIKPTLAANFWLYSFSFFFVFLLITLVVMIISSRNYKLSIGDGKLHIKSIFYNTTINLSDIKKEDLKVINLNTSDIKIRFKLNGIGLPGLSIGWFSGGGQKYKLYITDKTHVLVIPTIKGYTILFSTLQGQEIIKEIML